MLDYHISLLSVKNAEVRLDPEDLLRRGAPPDSLLPDGFDASPGHAHHPGHHEDKPHREEAAAVDLELGGRREGEPGTVRHDGGEESLEGEGEESVETKHQAVAPLTDPAGDLEASHGDHHLVESSEDQVPGIAHPNGVNRSHQIEHYTVQEGDGSQGEVAYEGPVEPDEAEEESQSSPKQGGESLHGAIVKLTGLGLGLEILPERLYVVTNLNIFS